jgi:hypothetical protein
MTASPSADPIIQDVTQRIEFHRRWRRIWSATYFTGAAATVICAALATASAGFITDTGGGKMLTAGFALAATVLTSLEKILKMREKWDLHRNNQQAFEIVRLKALATTAESLGVVSQIETIEQSYSLQLGELNAAPATKEHGG